MGYTNPQNPVTAGMTGHLTDHDDIASDLVTLESHVGDGVPGATAAYRLAGATASGAPASGTFLLGDIVLDQTGTLWICTVAGSPGTWTQVQGGGGVTLDSTTGDIAASPGTAAAGANSKAARADHVHPNPAVLAPTGNTGATQASRYAGATTSGSPASGTYAVGDFIIGRDGTVWICTGAGTPGTWTQVGGSSITLDSTATDIQPFGTQSAGSNSKAARADHVHPDAGKIYAMALGRAMP